MLHLSVYVRTSPFFAQPTHSIIMSSTVTSADNSSIETTITTTTAVDEDKMVTYRLRSSKGERADETLQQPSSETELSYGVIVADIKATFSQLNQVTFDYKTMRDQATAAQIASEATIKKAKQEVLELKAGNLKREERVDLIHSLIASSSPSRPSDKLTFEQAAYLQKLCVELTMLQEESMSNLEQQRLLTNGIDSLESGLDQLHIEIAQFDASVKRELVEIAGDLSPSFVARYADLHLLLKNGKN